MKQNIEQILVPYDGSKNSDKVFKNVLEFAKRFDAKILLLACIKDIATFGFFKSKSDKKLIEKQKSVAEKKMQVLKKQAVQFDVRIKSKTVKCDVISKKIVEYAKKEKVDIIVMSKNREGTVAEKMYHESTTEKVFEEAPCTFMNIR